MKYSFEDIKSQVVLITGAGRGIGKATAELFAYMGAQIVISDIDEDVCLKASQEISKRTGANTMTRVCDVRDRKQVDAMTQSVIDRWGKIDCVINNAGITQDGMFLRMKEEQWKYIIDVNLNGTYQVTHSCIAHMRKKRTGTIINMSSIARGGNAGQCNYSAAKAGVVGFTSALAKEIASIGIRVNCIAPGYIDTRLTEVIPDHLAEQMVQSIPLKRKGTPNDVAKVCLFLASDLSAYMTGNAIDVNGGLRL